MLILKEMSIRNFKAWGGAVNTIEIISQYDKLDEFDNLIETEYPNGLSETALNDILWFDSQWVYDVLDIEEEGF